MNRTVSPSVTQTELRYQVALSMIEGVGGTVGRQLLSYIGGAEQVFNSNGKQLLRVPFIGETLARRILSFDRWARVDEELSFISRNKIKPIFLADKEYPQRFRLFTDTPFLFYYKGTADLNAHRTVGIVGTRKSTEYGRVITEQIIKDLIPYKPLIISGLAFGIDAVAHKAALQYNLETVGVMGNGLNRIYPALHKSLADKMTSSGGLLTEFNSQMRIAPENFALRNRLVAALSDVVIVVESSLNGGALITADMANQYHKEVMAVPGKVGDSHSAGCNNLIKQHKAHMLESVEDIVTLMGWELEKKPLQSALIFDLDEDERLIIEYLGNHPNSHVDRIADELHRNPTQLSAQLLQLEMKGAVQALPGKRYRNI